MIPLFTECAALGATLAASKSAAALGATLAASKSAAALASTLPTILDCSWLPPGTSQRSLYLERRIPTARFFDLDAVSDTASPLPHMLPSAADFSLHMSALGVSKQRPVVVYDRHGLLAAARVLWTLRAFGHPSASILLGGLPRWESLQLPVETGPPPAAPEAAPEAWALAPHAAWSLAQVRALSSAATAGSSSGGAAAEAQGLLVDARAAPRFQGLAPEPRPGLESGHIPGSVNVPFTALLEGQAATGLQLLPADSLRAVLAAAGVLPTQQGQLVLTCGSGVTSCVLHVAMLALGRPEASMSVYDGSFAEWGLPGQNPVAKGTGK